MSVDGRTVVIFDEAEVRWVERDGVTHSISYSHLTELRVDARPRRRPRFVALGAEARRWEMPLADSDVARLQAVRSSSMLGPSSGCRSALIQ